MTERIVALFHVELCISCSVLPELTTAHPLPGSWLSRLGLSRYILIVKMSSRRLKHPLVLTGHCGSKSPSAFTNFTVVAVLPDVIERSKLSVIVHGLAYFLLIAEGARLGARIVLQK